MLVKGAPDHYSESPSYPAVLIGRYNWAPYFVKWLQWEPLEEATRLDKSRPHFGITESDSF